MSRGPATHEVVAGYKLPALMDELNDLSQKGWEIVGAVQGARLEDGFFYFATLRFL